MPENTSDFYSHRTHKKNLEGILRQGEIKSLKLLAKDRPNLKVTVEPYRTSLIRKTLKASDAYEKLKANGKNADHIFLTRGGYTGNDNYGEYIIVKKLSHPIPSKNINTIRGEHITPSRLSVRSNAHIYVPTDEVQEWKEKFPQYKIRDRANIPLKRYPKHDPLNLVEKSIGAMEDTLGWNKAASLLEDRYAGRLHAHGAEALGVSDERSDKDYLVHLKDLDQVEAEKAFLASNGFHEMPYVTKRMYNDEEGGVPAAMSGVVDGGKVDVLLGHGPRVQRRFESVGRARQRLSDSGREQILAEKNRIKDTQLFRDIRLQRYKRDVDDFLAIEPIGQSPNRLLYPLARLVDGPVELDIQAPFSSQDLRRYFGRNARYTGSTALGIDTPDSDVDVFVPYKTQKHYQASLERARQRLPDLTPSPYNKKRENVHVMSGTLKHHSVPYDVDVTYGTGQKVWDRQKSIEAAANRLTDEERQRIRREKRTLKSAPIVGRDRYAEYKRKLDQDLGIVRL